MIRLVLLFEILFFLPDGWHTYGYYKYATCIDNIDDASKSITLAEESFNESMKNEYERLSKALGALSVKSVKLKHDYSDFEEYDFIGIEKVGGDCHDL
jgi:hypothetical protein